MSLSTRDRRAVGVAALCALVFLAIRFWPESSSGVAMTSDSIPQAESRLQRLRQRAAVFPARKDLLDKVRLDVAKREKALLPAETAPLAQAQLLQITRSILKDQQPPVEIKNVELSPAQPFGDHYGQVSVVLSVEANIEQIVNLLADLESQPELVAASDIQMGQASAKEKRIQARLSIAAIVPRKLAPVKKAQGGPLF
jgi:hypothetical protein